MNFYVEIVKRGDPEEVVKRMGPMSFHQAARVDAGANINLNHEEYSVRMTRERKPPAKKG